MFKDKKDDSDIKINKKSFEALMNMKYMKSVIDPGEAVGIMAGQSESSRPLLYVEMMLTLLF